MYSVASLRVRDSTELSLFPISLSSSSPFLQDLAPSMDPVIAGEAELLQGITVGHHLLECFAAQELTRFLSQSVTGSSTPSSLKTATQGTITSSSKLLLSVVDHARSAKEL